MSPQTKRYRRVFARRILCAHHTKNGSKHLNTLGQERTGNRNQTECRIQLEQWAIDLGNGSIPRHPGIEAIGRLGPDGARRGQQGVQTNPREHRAGVLVGQVGFQAGGAAQERGASCAWRGSLRAG